MNTDYYNYYNHHFKERDVEMYKIARKIKFYDKHFTV